MIVTTPHLDPPNGITWQVHKQHSIASLSPPKDLKQRLQVLPQSYLRDRRVTDTFKLAVTPGRGSDELAAARTGDSTTAWPEAHYLAPLHPVLEWAADRALAELSRDEIFVVRGAVDSPTVLVSVTQSDHRGQVVASSYYTVEFPEPALPLPTAHPSADEAIAALGLSGVNAGDLGDVSGFQPLVAAAVSAVDSAAEFHAQAIRAETRQRVDEWVARTARWKQQALNLTQHSGLRQRARRIDDEQALAEEMNPEHRLVRPLLVVVPA